MMQCLGRLYVRYFNARHQRAGTLWEGRFKSALVDSAAYYLSCSCYVDLNPVRAGMVSAPGEYGVPITNGVWIERDAGGDRPVVLHSARARRSTVSSARPPEL